MRKALLVGINHYRPPLQLNCCVNDAVALGTVLEKNGDGSPNFESLIKTKINSRSELREAIKTLFSGDEEIALLYFSGHGFINELGGFLVTPDVERYDEGVPMRDVLAFADKSMVKNKIIILDCCHSGDIGNPNVDNHNVSQLKEGTTILTASRADESAIEMNGHGVFTNLLLDALQGGAADLGGHVTPGGIYAFVDQALGAWCQRPIFKTHVSRFVSLRSVCPQVPLETIRKLVNFFPSSNDSFQLDPSFEDTNSPSVEHRVIMPYADPMNTAKLKDLQELVSIGLVVPNEEKCMYFAAMRSKSCKLTALGAHYWQLVKDNRL